MKREIITICGLAFILFIGCMESNKTFFNTKNNINQSNTDNYNKKLNNSVIQKESLVLKEAQKNYQDSYNEYVRCLRESGPQTVETLQALSLYQKHYQIYQMLLKAESDKK